MCTFDDMMIMMIQHKHMYDDTEQQTNTEQQINKK